MTTFFCLLSYFHFLYLDVLQVFSVFFFKFLQHYLIPKLFKAEIDHHEINFIDIAEVTPFVRLCFQFCSSQKCVMNRFKYMQTELYMTMCIMLKQFNISKKYFNFCVDFSLGSYHPLALSNNVTIPTFSSTFFFKQTCSFIWRVGICNYFSNFCILFHNFPLVKDSSLLLIKTNFQSFVFSESQILTDF